MSRRGGLRGRGDRGEDIALQYLTGLGYRLVTRNYQTRYGELDLILTHDDTLVFVEVKSRRDTAFGHPLEAVTPAKMRKLAIVAGQYLAHEDTPEYAEVRFDVVGIIGSGGGDAHITHIEDAFDVI